MITNTHCVTLMVAAKVHTPSATGMITSRAIDTPSGCSKRSSLTSPSGSLSYHFVGEGSLITRTPQQHPSTSTVPSDGCVERFTRLMPNIAQSRHWPPSSLDVSSCRHSALN